MKTKTVPGVGFLPDAFPFQFPYLLRLKQVRRDIAAATDVALHADPGFKCRPLAELNTEAAVLYKVSLQRGCFGSCATPVSVLLCCPPDDMFVAPTSVCWAASAVWCWLASASACKLPAEQEAAI